MSVGIVLARTTRREFDEIISLMTPDHGRIDVLARGLKKITSKLSPHLMVLSHVRYEAAPGKEMPVLIAASTEDSFVPLRSAYHLSMQAAYVANLVHELTRTGIVEKGMYELLLEWLQYLSSIESSSSPAIDWFVLHALYFVGFGPTYSFCVSCGLHEYPEYWTYEGGGALCASCAKTTEYMHSSVRVPSGSLQELEAFDRASIRALPQVNDFLHQLIFNHLQYHTETKFSDWAYLDSGLVAMDKV